MDDAMRGGMAEGQVPNSILTLEAIFSEAAYTHAVLQLEDGTTESDLGNAIRQEAQVAGVDVEALSDDAAGKRTYTGAATPPTRNAQSVSPSPPHHRRSASIDSHKTWSTGVTSAYSSISIDEQISKSTSPIRRFLHFPRASLDHAPSPVISPLASPHNSSTTSIHTVPTSTTARAVTDSDHYPRRNSKLKRGLDVLSKFKRTRVDNDSRTCLRCAQSQEPQRTLAIRLPCQHYICRAHLRKLVVDALISHAVDSLQCCGQPFPRDILLEVSKEEEVKVLLQPESTPVFEGNDPFQDLGRAISPDIVEQGICTLHNDNGWKDSPFDDDHSLQAQRNAYLALTDPEFRSMRNTQLDERDRFLTFQNEQRRLLSQYQAQCRRMCAQSHRKMEHDLEQAHILALSHLEDVHLAAELDLSEAQSHEKRNCALALRHMEAYCDCGPHSGETHPVTERDFRELERQRWEHDHMAQRHASAIKVLREQQARQLRQRAQAQEEEVRLLAPKQAKELEDLETSFRSMDARLEELGEERRRRLVARWDMAVEIWKRRRVAAGQMSLPYPIQGIEWPLLREFKVGVIMAEKEMSDDLEKEETQNTTLRLDACSESVSMSL